METISKHVAKATAIRGHYKFKHAEVETIMKAADFCEGFYARQFAWEGAFIQGRQLATADLIQAKWPGIWEHFCEAMFPGMLAFKAQIDARGKHELSEDEEDMIIQAHVDYHLCQCLLQDSAFFRWDYPDSPVWRALEVFQDPTTPFMKWHHDALTPWVRQLRHDADRCHASFSNMRGGRTVLDTARINLGIEKASTLDQSRLLLQEMVKLLDAEKAGSNAVQILPAHPPPPPPVPDVFVPVLRMPKEVTEQSVLLLRPLWDLWEAKLRQYYSPLLKGDERKTPPAWEHRDKEKFQARQDMLRSQKLRPRRREGRRTQLQTGGWPPNRCSPPGMQE